MHAPRTSAAIAAFGDPVLAMPPDLDERQRRLARVALANIPPPPRRLPPRLVQSEAFRLPIVGGVARFIPGLMERLRADILHGARGIAEVTGVTRAASAQGNSQDFWSVGLRYLVDDVSHTLEVRAVENDAADARNARILPIVVDLARPSRVIVWWSALDIR